MYEALDGVYLHACGEGFCMPVQGLIAASQSTCAAIGHKRTTGSLPQACDVARIDQ